MSEPILSQQEIDALLQGSDTQSSIDEDLLNIFLPLKQQLQAPVDRIIGHAVYLEGPYVERVQQHLANIYHQPILVIPGSLAGVSFFLITTDSDGENLANTLGVALEQAINKVATHWLAALSAKLSLRQSSISLGPLQLISKDQLSKMPLTEDTYMVRQGLTWDNTGTELAVMLFTSQAEKLLSLVKPDNARGSEPPRDSGQGSSARKPRTGHRLIRDSQQYPVTSLEFVPLTASKEHSGSQEIKLLRDVELPVTIELGTATMTLQDLMELTTGKVIKLTKIAGEPGEIFINGHSIAKAEIIVLDDNFGARILEIVPPRDRLKTK